MCDWLDFPSLCALHIQKKTNIDFGGLLIDGLFSDRRPPGVGRGRGRGREDGGRPVKGIGRGLDDAKAAGGGRGRGGSGGKTGGSRG